jgi:hypothetical protein
VVVGGSSAAIHAVELGAASFDFKGSVAVETREA